ncbi:hypothetical protein JY651_21050 [Pyxidicoccus parkwayensis]|uniref:Lipoprotein n=1 Tax=Pyxidicoccus parkwayensis TaxID=2813578 RepID=A0ABX7P9Y5_9BACT|nr:hypothetical protein [Pyxidicoccus parkwaysis]QSQ27247.1 hypothetical protein JY651_21050 [Pyxidicoccus parkwaysis]
MRAYLLTAALLLVSCDTTPEPRPPPFTRLVYPSGLAFWHPEGGSSTNGYLYVASANFDKCYDSGDVTALDLDALGVRPFGAPFTQTVEEDRGTLITNLGVGTQSYVQIESFAGEMALWAPPGRTPRLFVPARAEGSYLHAIDVAADGVSLSCAQGGTTRDCRADALSLLNVPGASGPFPSAPSPMGVTVERTNPDSRVWVTHSELVGPEESKQESQFQNYLVDIPAADPTLDSLSVDSFLPMSTNGRLVGAAHAAALGGRYVYVSGRNSSSTQLGALPARYILRLVDRTATSRVLESDVEAVYTVREARGVAVVQRPKADDPTVLDPNRERVYLLARGPDTLLVLDVENALADTPTIRVVTSAPLPAGSSEVEVIPRAVGRGNIVAVTGSSSEAVALYDEEVGQLVAQVLVGDQNPSQPAQPFGLAADVRGNAARVFVSTFGDGRVAIIDIPDLDRPQDSRLVARLGTPQKRDPRQGTSVCSTETTP